MFVMSIRCTTRSSWRTSITAASSMMICELVMGIGGFMSLEEEGRDEREHGENERGAQQVRHAEKAQLCIREFNQHDCAGDREKFREKESHAERKRRWRHFTREPERKENVGEQCHEDELLDGCAKLDEREVAARIFEQHRFVNHREFEVRCRIVHWNASGLSEEHDEHRGERKRV